MDIKELTDIELLVLVYACAICISYPASILYWRWYHKKMYKETGNPIFLRRCP